MSRIIDRRRVMGGKLPYDAEIEYLESSGTQWIDLGIPFTDDITFDIDKIRLQNVENSGFIGYRFVNAATAQGNMRYLFAYDDGKIGVRLGVAVNNTIAISKNTFHKICYSGDRLNIDNWISLQLGRKFATSNFGNIYLFKCNADNYYSGDLHNFCGAIGSVRIEKNGVVVRDYIPVRVGQVGYMYDKVSKQLFGNSGTGSFILGPDK